MSDKFQIIYTPKIEDEVVIAQYNTMSEAQNHMEYIKTKSPKAYPHHYILHKGQDYNVRYQRNN